MNELPKDKRPPRNLWDKPWRLEQFLDSIFEKSKNRSEDTESRPYIYFNEEDVE